MGLNPNYPNHRLTDVELASLVVGAFGGGGLAIPGGPAPTPNDASAIAFAIVRAESDGVTNAERAEADNPLGGIDRGIWQWNSKAHPDISDADAYHPIVATQWAADKSNRGTDWGPWAYGPTSYRGTSRTDLDIAGAKTAIARVVLAGELMTASELRARFAALGFENNTIGNTIVENVSLGPLDALGSWAEGLTRLLGNLLSGEWWKRIGIGALGAGLVTLAVALIATSNRSNT